MERQQRVLGRCRVSYVLDQSALYRLVGSPEIMTAQLRHLLDVAARPNVVLQVMPEVAHVALAASYASLTTRSGSEHVASGDVFTDPSKSFRHLRSSTTIRLSAECHEPRRALWDYSRGLAETVGSPWRKSTYSDRDRRELRRSSQRRHGDGPRHGQSRRRDAGVQRCRMGAVPGHDPLAGWRFRPPSGRRVVQRGCPGAVTRCRARRSSQAARRRTSQTVAAMSSTDSASSQPPSIHWNGQNRVAG